MKKLTLIFAIALFSCKSDLDKEIERAQSKKDSTHKLVIEAEKKLKDLEKR